MLTSQVDPLVPVIDAIAKQGYAIVEHFLSAEEIASLMTVVTQKWMTGQMVSAKTGKGKLKNQAIRGDYIAWLDEQDENAAVQAYFRQMELLRMRLNMQLFMNVQELETHVAVYPVGTVYQKHLDQFSHGAHPHSQARQLSAVLYLNPNWEAVHGGALRLHLNETDYVDVLPNAGRVVLFLSSKFWHEVLPATRERLSITGWFRTRQQSII